MIPRDFLEQPNHPFYGRYTCPPALATGNWRILLVQSFTAHMPLLMATNIFGLGRRRRTSPQQCYIMHCLRTFFGTSEGRKLKSEVYTECSIIMAAVVALKMSANFLYFI